ncbi:sulfite oxidase [Saccharopolyspora sp. CA-218241]|uniref:sulfite oxidase n=1 Tax=Saccharopolyspora sp. CA-218241 TaxID=3240027 RepID=UPI003D9799B9
MGQAGGRDRARAGTVQRRAAPRGAGGGAPHPAGHLVRPQPRPGARDRPGGLAAPGGRARRPTAGAVPGELRSRFTAHELVATLQCAGNRRAGLARVRDIPGEAPWGPGATATASWTGVRLADVLAAAGADPDAGHVAFEAPDVSRIASPPQRFGGSIPAAKARGGEVLLAWAMNDEPLPAVHGAPVRAVVPGYIGARSVKWLDRITVQDHPSDNFFQATSYRLLPPEADPAAAGPGDGISLGPLALNSDILLPEDGAQLRAGPATVRGYALAGDDRDVARVDVSADGGRTWTQAELDGPSGPWTWRLWRTSLDLPPGPVTLTARAWDTTAAAQPEHAAHLWNPKGYANNAWAQVHVTSSF